MLTDSQRQAIRDHVDLRDVYLEMVDRPLLRGKVCRCPDPAHDDVTPSASIDATGWHCHACGSKGDVIALVQLVTGCTFGEAADTVLRRLGDRLSARGLTIAPTPVGLYLRDTNKYLVPPTEARIEAMRRIWNIVSGTLRHDSVCAGWLRSRGLDVDVAMQLGCTDWQRVAAKLEAEIGRWPTDLKNESGLYSSGKRTWYPLTQIYREGNSGVAIPCHHPAAPWPIAYRWRWAKPVKFTDKTIKTHAMYGPVYPVGLRTHGPFVSSPSDASVVFICEGEPDWLAVHTAVSAHPKWREEVAAVSICDVAAGLRSEVVNAINPKARIILATHDNGASQTLVRDLMHLVPAGRRTLALVPESHDLNDRLQAGTLSDWIRRVLG